MLNLLIIKKKKKRKLEIKDRLDINLKNNNISDDNLKIKAKYISLIEGLENELKLEKTKNNKLKDIYNSDEIIKLKNDELQLIKNKRQF